MAGNLNESANMSGGMNGGQLHNLLNGGGDQVDNIKHSPASVHGANGNSSNTPGNGGGIQTNPGSMLASAGGPSSATGAHGPGSVHSQQSGGGPGSGGGMPISQQQTMSEMAGQEFQPSYMVR